MCLVNLKGNFVNNYARTVEDTVDFLIKNLYEMNRLWIKLYNSTSKTRSQRETERNELNMLVGENIVRLSSLEGVTLNVYQTSVLNQLLELVQNCKDSLSQQYLTDSIIQVFPDEYHLHTLEKLFDGCTKQIGRAHV